MIVIVCVDDKNGMMFNHRRQSKDKVLREHVMNLIGAHHLYMNNYTKSQFEDSDKIIVDELFLDKIGNGDYCFIEDVDISNYLNKIEKIILFKWNCHYPADVYLSIDMNQWTLESSEDFAGYSHNKITKEVYIQ